jgi:hypothetical protein
MGLTKQVFEDEQDKEIAREAKEQGLTVEEYLKLEEEKQIIDSQSRVDTSELT